MHDVEKRNEQVDLCVVGDPEPDIRVGNIERFRLDALLVWP